MNKVKNLDAGKELLAIYDALTLQQIKDAWRVSGGYTMRHLTGFGKIDSCKLCKALLKSDWDSDCRGCLYNAFTKHNISMVCNEIQFDKSYNRIEKSTTPRRCFNAVKARAEVLRNQIQLIQKEQK